MDVERVEEIQPASQDIALSPEIVERLVQDLHEVFQSLETASSRLTTAEVAMVLAILSQSSPNSRKFRYAEKQLAQENFPEAVLLPALLHLPGIDEALFNKHASNALIAVIKALVDVLGDNLETKRNTALATVAAAELLNRDRYTKVNPFGRQIISVAQDVCGKNGEKVVNKPAEFIHTKEQLFARAKKWILNLQAPGNKAGYEVNYECSTAAFDVVSQIGVVAQENIKFTFSPKAEQILLALIFGVNSTSTVNGRMVKDQISSEVKAKILRVYRQCMQKQPNELAGYTPELGMPLSRMKMVNAGVKLDCPIAYELFVEQVNGVSRSDEQFEDERDATLHALRGEPDYHPIIRALLQLVLERHVDTIAPAQCSHPFAQDLSVEGLLLNLALGKSFFFGEWHIFKEQAARRPTDLYIHHIVNMLTNRAKKFSRQMSHV